MCAHRDHDFWLLNAELLTILITWYEPFRETLTRA